MEQVRPTTLYIDGGIIRHNLRVLRRQLKPNVKMMLAVKADAYGHGMVFTSRVAKGENVDGLAVALPEEGAALREAGLDGMILVLGGVTDEGAAMSVKHDLSQAVFSVCTLRAMQAAAVKLAKVAKAHVKIDTGMTRIGVTNFDALEAILQAWKDCPNVDMEGIFTHFAEADDTESGYTREQYARFMGYVERARSAGFTPIAHCSNSAGALYYPEYQMDMVRIGIAAYAGIETDLALFPAQQWVTRPVRIERFPKGRFVGYGRTFLTERETVIATLPVGYGDGYKRMIGNCGEVLVRGQYAKVIGRVCMDQCMIDVTDVEGVTLFDEVVLLGGQERERIWPSDMADWCGTISYEIMLSIMPRVPRVFVNG